jgi:hypothetical protein
MRLVVGSCRVDEEHAWGQMPTAPSRIDDMLANEGLTTPGGPDGAVRLPRTCLHLSAMTTGLRDLRAQYLWQPTGLARNGLGVALLINRQGPANRVGVGHRNVRPPRRFEPSSNITRRRPTQLEPCVLIVRGSSLAIKTRRGQPRAGPSAAHRGK